MKNWLLATALIFLFVPNSQAKAPILSYQAEYELGWNSIPVGISKHKVQEIKPNRFIAEAHSFPILSFLPFEDFERSEFILDEHRFKPLTHYYRSQAYRKKMVGELTFDWKNLKVINKAKNKTVEQDSFPNDAHDKISFFFQLKKDIKAGKIDLHYTVIEAKKINRWQIKVIAEEKIKTQLGTLTAIKLENSLDNRDRVTHFWLAKDLDFILVKLVQFRKGKKTADVHIKKLQYL